MVEAIVLVQVKAGMSSAVVEAVGEIGGVSEAYVVTGTTSSSGWRRTASTSRRWRASREP